MSKGHKTYVIPVEEMFCENCEKRITGKLSSIDGVSACKASYERSEVWVTCDGSVSRKTLVEEIASLGYSEKKGNQRTVQIVSILMIILAMYLILNHLGLLNIFNIFPTIESTVELPFLFVIGLLTSVHCIAMCGGINLTQSVNAAQKKEKTLKSNLLYNLGRVISYTVIGGIAGAVGSVLSSGGSFKGIVAIIAGAIMLLMALRMLGIFRSLRKLRLPIPKKLAVGYAKLIRGRSSFFIGLLNGLIPCGPLQSMQIYALSTGSFLLGALSMLLFSLGTVPLMFGFGFISGKLNAKYTRYMLTVSAVLIFVMGLSMLTNGLSLSGLNVPKAVSEQPKEAVMSGDIQTVTTEVDYGSYEPFIVKSSIPVEWTIIVPEDKLNGCNGEIIVPAYDIDVKLHEGENTVTFTPQKTGTVSYTCWMGMIKSNIIVE